jgi:hypothetical protein
MATILPTDWRLSSFSGAVPYEYETLALLDESLPDDLTVFHSLHWTRAHPRNTQWGEIDFCILNSAGKVLVIEQKNGALLETAEGLVKRYNRHEKNVARQVQRSVDALRAKFYAMHGKAQALQVDYLIFCPDHRLQTLNAVSLDRTRIVDAGQRERLPEIAVDLLSGDGGGLGKTSDTDSKAAFQRLFRFFCDDLRLYPDVAALSERQQRYYAAQAGGLAETLSQLEFSPRRLCVRGTAGCGKTQAALAEFQRARAAGESALLTCFNRPLAECFAAWAGEGGGRVATLHQICLEIAQAQGVFPPDFRGSDADWPALFKAALAREIPEAFRFSTLIVDEGQDFSPDWVALADRLLRPGGRLLWLEDPRQRLYGETDDTRGGDFLARYPQGVVFQARRNFRNPGTVATALYQLLGISPHEIEAANPVEGMEVGIHVYRSAEELQTLSAQCLQDLCQAGFKPEDMVLVGFHGLRHSQALRWETLGGFTLARFTGEYDAAGRQVMTAGEVRAESVFRFKGQHAPAVVFTEIDFETLNESIRNRLFCGMTRPTLKLDLVLSERAAQALLGGG